MALDEKTIAFIGAGHITSILLNNLVKAGKLWFRTVYLIGKLTKGLEVLS